VVEGAEPPTPAQHGRFVIDRALDEALRTPLDRIVDAAESIAERAHGPLRSDYTAYANDIAAAARHLLSVIHAMSEEPGSGHAPIDLPTLAAEAIILVESAAQARNVRIVLSASRPLAASGEERAVIQILVNLIGNAVRHSREGGVVTLRFARDRDLASVTVADEGPGIAPADQQRIFERFERADPTAGGTGLGLAISRRLARSMSGDIGLESAPDQGARFTLTLPAA
jgi:signal transduction histidine kinase